MNANDAKVLKQWDPIWVRVGTITREDVVMSTERYPDTGAILIETRTCGWVGPSRVERRTDEAKPPEGTWSADDDQATSDEPTGR